MSDKNSSAWRENMAGLLLWKNKIFCGWIYPVSAQTLKTTLLLQKPQTDRWTSKDKFHTHTHTHTLVLYLARRRERWQTWWCRTSAQGRKRWAAHAWQSRRGAGRRVPDWRRCCRWWWCTGSHLLAWSQTGAITFCGLEHLVFAK